MSDLETTTSLEIDLGLQIPPGFSLKSLFPDDRLLRLNPHWFVTEFQQDDTSFSVKIEDYATEEAFSLKGTIVYPQSGIELLDIKLSGGFSEQITFFVRNNTLKARIISPNGSIADETDNPLLLWIRGIREYIRIYLKKTPTTLFFRLLMNRMVLTMNPSQRKICMMLVKITAVEVVVILFIIVAYVIFVL